MPKISTKVLVEVVDAKVGSDALNVALSLKAQGEVSEFTLAKKLKEDINSVRNKLYRLQQNSLISYKKRKDEEKGWYVYFWQLAPERFRYLHKEMLASELSRVKKRLDASKEEIRYKCPNDGLVQRCEDALSTNFICPNCGAVLCQEDRSKDVARLTKQKQRLTKSMGKCS
jgi:transcription initiation factor TFIIE subunit alpha